ncbi:diacylglycerol kinase family lipid kinase [Hoyosella rhizosphaerae]|uniref:DAGKc domain-containing protein n=1 Tax=Hoyosella rhizosphaerae TaxID=1755582 RepID=A0A916U4U1_9ACTN|nr:diacylglycerol kinase family protein [Hoyosella rhizosphaerae]MBN4926271.1 diacylglycerol kinase family lipid kinase [Hoyosella rhizosphaerae]GGC60718.1 hypothetical protein GCM10011410_11490 [Hoyosella rhizosphaerae]
MTTSRSFHFLVNPRSGGGAAVKAVSPVVNRLRKAGAAVTVTYSTGKQRCRDMIPESVGRGETIVAVGGDGMVGSLAGVTARAGGVLGIVPTGRGNDFARQLGLPKDPDAVADTLLNGAQQRVDLIDVTGPDSQTHTVVGSVYAGVDSYASTIVDTAHWLPRKLQYPYAALKALAEFEPTTYKVTVDGEKFLFKGCTVVIANSGYYGSGMHIAPDADPCDGKLDVVMVAAASRLKLIRELPKLYQGKHTGVSGVEIARGVEVTVAIKGGRVVDAYGDGDPLASLPVAARVKPGALTVLVPR